MGFDAILLAESLAKFVKDNYLDGVDIHYMDTQAFIAGTAESWLIDFITRLRYLLPNHIICQSLLNFYFQPDYYMNGGFLRINREVGNKLTFYSVLYYN